MNQFWPNIMLVGTAMKTPLDSFVLIAAKEEKIFLKLRLV
jgi:hypothetical protein